MQLLDCYLNLQQKFGAILSKTYKDMTLYPHIIAIASEKLQYTGMAFV